VKVAFPEKIPENFWPGTYATMKHESHFSFFTFYFHNASQLSET